MAGSKGEVNMKVLVPFFIWLSFSLFCCCCSFHMRKEYGFLFLPEQGMRQQASRWSRQPSSEIPTGLHSQQFSASLWQVRQPCLNLLLQSIAALVLCHVLRHHLIGSVTSSVIHANYPKSLMNQWQILSWGFEELLITIMMAVHQRHDDALHFFPTSCCLTGLSQIKHVSPSQCVCFSIFCLPQSSHVALFGRPVSCGFLVWRLNCAVVVELLFFPFFFAGIWPEGADGTDINTVCRDNGGKLCATGDDFGKVNLFRYPVPQAKVSSSGFLNFIPLASTFSCVASTSMAASGSADHVLPKTCWIQL